jgi:hypothetical protein
MGDHTETLQLDYDPDRISYEELLAVFWESHNPGRKTWRPQYKAAVFYHDEGQRELAVKTRDRLAAGLGGAIHTEILPYTGFTLAEDYHQKYYLQGASTFREDLARYYPTAEQLVDSTAAARINGYLGGYGHMADLLRTVDSLGLSVEVRKRLLERGRSRLRG